MHTHTLSHQNDYSSVRQRSWRVHLRQHWQWTAGTSGRPRHEWPRRAFSCGPWSPARTSCCPTSTDGQSSRGLQWAKSRWRQKKKKEKHQTWDRDFYMIIIIQTPVIEQILHYCVQNTEEKKPKQQKWSKTREKPLPFTSIVHSWCYDSQLYGVELKLCVLPSYSYLNKPSDSEMLQGHPSFWDPQPLLENILSNIFFIFYILYIF